MNHSDRWLYIPKYILQLHPTIQNRALEMFCMIDSVLQLPIYTPCIIRISDVSEESTEI